MMEQNSLACDAVEARRLDNGVAVGARVRPSPIVGNGEEDIRRPVLRRRTRGEREQKNVENRDRAARFRDGRAPQKLPPQRS